MHCKQICSKAITWLIAILLKGETDTMTYTAHNTGNNTIQRAISLFKRTTPPTHNYDQYFLFLVPGRSVAVPVRWLDSGASPSV